MSHGYDDADRSRQDYGGGTAATRRPTVRAVTHVLSQSSNAAAFLIAQT
jgi:hypothetical protein